MRRRKAMPPLNLPVYFLGRPVKPVSLGLAITMLALMVINIFHAGLFIDSFWSVVIATVSGMSVVLFFYGWVRTSHIADEWGMMLSTAVLITRAAALFFTFGLSQIDLYLSIGLAFISAGSYALERTDPRHWGTEGCHRN